MQYGCHIKSGVAHSLISTLIMKMSSLFKSFPQSYNTDTTCHFLEADSLSFPPCSGIQKKIPQAYLFSKNCHSFEQITTWKFSFIVTISASARVNQYPFSLSIIFISYDLLIHFYYTSNL